MVVKTLKSALLTLIAAVLLLIAVLAFMAMADPGFKQKLSGWLDDYLISPWVEEHAPVRQLREQVATAQRRTAEQERTIAALRRNETALEGELDALRAKLDAAHSRDTDRDQALVREQQRFEQEFAILRQRLEQEAQSKEVAIEQLRDEFTVIRVGDRVLFDTGSAALKRSGRKILALIASALNKFPERPIRIEGHTDDRPIVTPAIQARFPTNWELSAARAITAARFLQEQGGVAPSRLVPAGLADNHPVASNATAEGRTRNRRIEIVLLPPSRSFQIRSYTPAVD